MQQYTIKISDLAEEDLENAGDYIAYVLLNPTAAENTVRGIRKQVDKLQYLLLFTPSVFTVTEFSPLEVCLRQRAEFTLG